MTRLAIFASGGGSNAASIIQYFESIDDISVTLILSNKKEAFVHQRANNFGIPSKTFPAKVFKSGEEIIKTLKEYKIDYIILAGFLLLIPKILTDNFYNKIMNIHPALLPRYGGKGMYGGNVHQAVFDNFEKESGMTIHLVNEKYDDGQILFQKSVELMTTDTPDIIAQKVLRLEHEYYPKIIHEYIKQNAESQ